MWALLWTSSCDTTQTYAHRLCSLWWSYSRNSRIWVRASSLLRATKEGTLSCSEQRTNPNLCFRQSQLSRTRSCITFSRSLGYVRPSHNLLTFQFLEGLVHQTNICSDFMSDNGINSLFEIMSLPCIPVDFATMPAASAALKILRVLVHTDTDGIRNVSMRLHERLFHLHALEDWPQAEKLFGQMVAYASGDQAKDDSAALSAPDLYRHLCVASTAVMLFADLMSHLAQHYPRTASLVLPAVANGDGKDITTLCRLQRVCAGQAIAVKAISDKAQPTDATASTDHARLSVTTSPIEQSALEPRVETGERSKGGTKTKPMLGHLKPLRDVAIRLSSGVGSMMTGEYIWVFCMQSCFNGCRYR